MNPLFTPVRVGPLALKHRVVLAPLTRLRSGEAGVPPALMAEYYGQRASDGGLMVTEATTVAATGRGYLGAPGLHDDAQIAGWRKVVDAVHAKGARIFTQLWHVGRVSHVSLQPNGEAPVAPSSVPFEGVAFTQEGWVPVSPARALRTDEIPGIVESYRRAAERAKAAGFDGVELHAANGYLLDQFLQDSTNHRTDGYGGPVENRARLLLEIVEAIAPVWGADRIGVRLSPSGTFHEMRDSDPRALFGYVARRLGERGLAYLHVVEPRVKGSELIDAGAGPVAAAWLRGLFGGPVIAAGGFEPDSAAQAVADGAADLVAFGRHFISNPDLPERIRLGLPLNPYDRATFYGGAEQGYTDYPFAAAAV